MPGEPFAWNIVLIGAWNTAILSPDGVRKHLFRLAEAMPIELQVAIDRPGHFRIKHDGVVVIPTRSRLETVAAGGTVAELARAAEISQRALAELPRTPVTAAGVNVRYRVDELSDDVLARVHAPLDEELAHAAYRIQDSSLKRTVEFGDGVLNLTISHSPAGNGVLDFNFHRDSRDPEELSRWIERTTDFVAAAEALAEVIGVRDVG